MYGGRITKRTKRVSKSRKTNKRQRKSRQIGGVDKGDFKEVGKQLFYQPLKIV